MRFDIVEAIAVGLLAAGVTILVVKLLLDDRDRAIRDGGEEGWSWFGGRESGDGGGGGDGGGD